MEITNKSLIGDVLDYDINTAEFFFEIGMPTSLHDLDISPNDEDCRLLALDATMNDTLKLSRIKPLGAKDIERIFKRAK